jgi:hypothetical protein
MFVEMGDGVIKSHLLKYCHLTALVRFHVITHFNCQLIYLGFVVMNDAESFVR